MSSVHSPIAPEFETVEQAARHARWFRAKVEEALHSENPRLPHDAAMAKVQAMLEARRKARANRAQSALSSSPQSTLFFSANACS